MNTLLNLLMVVQILSALGMIGLILIQHGKGADMGAAFGSGTSGSLFGASGGANFLSRTTAVLAAVFFVCTLAQAYFGNLPTSPTSQSSVLERSQPAVAPTAADQVPGAVPPAASVNPPASEGTKSPASQIPGK
jgi:preprotein translocase subunit SecG